MDGNRILRIEVAHRSLPGGLHIKRGLVSTRRVRLGFLLEHCCGWRNGSFSVLEAANLLIKLSKEALNAETRTPPRRTKAAERLKNASSARATVPLEQLWTRIPSIPQQEILRRLTQMLAQRLAAGNEATAASLPMAADRDATLPGREVSDESLE